LFGCIWAITFEKQLETKRLAHWPDRPTDASTPAPKTNMSFLRKSLGAGKKKDPHLHQSASSTTLPPWMLEQQRQQGSNSPAAGSRGTSAGESEADRRKRLDSVNRYAAGGVAFTQVRKQEQSRVEKMQNQTFTRWVNLHLTGAGHQPVADLVQGFASGDSLLLLLSILSGQNPTRGTAARFDCRFSLFCHFRSWSSS